MADWHTHTNRSGGWGYNHGGGTLSDNLFQGNAKGLIEVGVADHGPGMLPWLGVCDEGQLLKSKEEASALNRQMEWQGIDTRVRVGVEANVMTLDGGLDVSRGLLKQLDYALVGLHQLVWPRQWRDWHGIFFRNYLVPGGFRAVKKRARLANTKALKEAILTHKEIDAITHPGLKMPIDTGELAEAAEKAGVALEINSSHRQANLDYIDVARGQGVDFVVGSDAHHPSRVGDFQWAEAVITKAGLAPEEIRNCRRPDGARPSIRRV